MYVRVMDDRSNVFSFSCDNWQYSAGAIIMRNCFLTRTQYSNGTVTNHMAPRTIPDTVVFKLGPSYMVSEVNGD